MIRRKRVIEQYRPEDKPIELATFAFDGHRLLAAYHDAAAQRMFEVHGIMGRDRHLTTADGAMFFDGLEAAFRRSSCLRVVAD